MLVRVKKHPTLGILVASNGMVFNRVRHSQNYKWTFGHITGMYDLVTISGKQYAVHRLVAETFLPNPEGKTWVDHILRDTHDNNVCQIRWSTPTENNRNRVNNIGIAELLTTDKKLYHKVWRSMYAEKLREKARNRYRAKMAAGFHMCTRPDGKKVWVHESELESFCNGDVVRINRILNESPRPRTSKTKSPMSLVKIKQLNLKQL